MLQADTRVTQNSMQPVIRISKGCFPSGVYAEVERLIRESAHQLAPAIEALHGLLYYHAAVDRNTNTIMNVSVWESEQAARQIETLAPMLAHRPILEANCVRFDPIANYLPLWKIEAGWSFGDRGRESRR